MIYLLVFYRSNNRISHIITAADSVDKLHDYVRNNMVGFYWNGHYHQFHQGEDSERYPEHMKIQPITPIN